MRTRFTVGLIFTIRFTFTSFSLTSSRGGGAAHCHHCEPGQALIDSACQECPKGHYSSKDGAPCIPCSVRTKPIPDSYFVVQPNTFAVHEGSAACLPCPNGMVSEEGADSCTMALGSDSVIGADLFDLKALSAKVGAPHSLSYITRLM